MKAFNQTTCALCNAPLKWWDAQTCTHCKQTICSHHVCTKRCAHSSVLAVTCTHCIEHSAPLATTVQRKHLATI